MFGDEYGDIVGNAEGDGVGGAGIHFDGFSAGAAVADDEFGEEGVVLEVVDEDAFELGAEFFDDVGEEFVGLGAWGGLVFEAAINGQSFDGANDDGELPLAFDFFEVDNLLVGGFGDDDAF